MKEVFGVMLPDKISKTAKNDPLICLYGDYLLRKHKRKQHRTVVSNKMRETARLLIALKAINSEIKTLADAMKPLFYTSLVNATKTISGYNPETHQFAASSLAMHMGTSLWHVCNVLHREIVAKTKILHFETDDKATKIKEIRNLLQLLDNHCASNISSLAQKHMHEAHWNKQQVIPLTGDLITFNAYCKKIADSLYQSLNEIVEKYDEGTVFDEEEKAHLIDVNRT